MDFTSFGRSLYNLAPKYSNEDLYQLVRFQMQIFRPTGGRIGGEDGVSCHEFVTEIVGGTSA